MSETPERIWADECFWPLVDRSGECWVWLGPVMGRGYGACRPGRGKPMTGAHRVAWSLHNGKWPEPGKVVMHSCDNPICVNPRHLALGTQSENIRQCVERGRHKPFRPIKKAECKNGHPYTPGNTETVLSRGIPVRRCKTCKAQTMRKWQERKNGK